MTYLFLLLSIFSLNMNYRFALRDKKQITNKEAFAYFSSDDLVSGSLYFENELIRHYQDITHFTYYIDEPGWLTFIGDDGYLYGAIGYPDQNHPFGFSKPYLIKNDHTFFLKPETTCFYQDEKGLINQQTFTQEGLYHLADYDLVIDEKAPQCRLENQKLIIDEAYLDKEQSKILFNGKDMMQALIFENDLYQLTIKQEGKLSVKLVDYSGNLFEEEYELSTHHQPLSFSYFLDHGYLKYQLENDSGIISKLELYRDMELVGLDTYLEDGYYQLKGEAKDSLGNLLIIDEAFYVDENAPYLYLSPKEKEFYEEKVTIAVEVGDVFLDDYQLMINKDGQFYAQYDKRDGLNMHICLSEEGQYDFELVAFDQFGHQSSLKESYILDFDCHPIAIEIAGMDASRVDEIVLTNPLHLEASCDEGEVKMSLYKDDKLIYEANASELDISNSEADYIKIEAKDPYGHQTSKIITFSEPAILEKQEAIEVESIKKDHLFNISWYLGGGFVALSYLLFRTNAHFRRKSKNVSLTKDSSEDTCLIESASS